MKNILLIILLFQSCLAFSQSNENNYSKNNAVSFELGKTGLIFNVNFDHKIDDKNFGYRIDAGSNFNQYLKLYTVGGGGYYLSGSERSFFELGIDLNYLSVTEVSDDQRSIAFIYPDYPIETFYGSMNIGYRNYGKKTLFRIGISPGFIKNDFLVGGYVSFGFRF
jgi:hypothetical protein